MDNEKRYLVLFGLRKANATLTSDLVYRSLDTDECSTDAERALTGQLGCGVEYTLKAGQPIWVHEDTAYIFLQGFELPADAFAVDTAEYTLVS
jgi:hypothetical protein